jgi:dUTPase
MLDAPKTIGSANTDEIRVLLINLGPAPFAVERGLPIAEVVPVRSSLARFEGKPG